MEQTLIHLVQTAAWFFFIVFIFAVIGVVATVRWIVNALTRGERAVEAGVVSVENHLHRG